jgi:hypothetical protein
MAQVPTLMDQSQISTRQSSASVGNRPRHELTHWIARWFLFFLVCLGLGYAAVQRYEPRTTAGLNDSALYYRLVSGDEVEARDIRFRALVPLIAKPFYLLARKFLAPERAVYLALLISNSIFCATTACLLIAVALRVAGSLALALLAGALYLLNFAVVNFQLAALIDAGEACLMMAVTATLFGDKWWLLMIWGILGALAKETFVPLAGVFVLVWWYVDHRKPSDRLAKLAPAIAMVIVAIATSVILRLAIAEHVLVSDIFQSATNSRSSYWSRLFTGVINRNFLYVFIWLLPLGLLGIRRLPRPWAAASIASGLTALALGAYRDIGGNVARPMFDVMGPILSLAAAIVLVGYPEVQQPGTTDAH